MSPRERIFDVRLRPEVHDDLKNLPTHRLRSIAVLRIQNLMYGEERGRELIGTADPDLTGCRRLYFDEIPRLARWRIVYRELPAHRPRTLPLIQILAVGPRAQMDVYERAALRLGLLTPDDMS
ncbi:hypothetical protein ACFYSC_22400 [Streptosporangium sp. NPDC004379]|uniref:hypothetical protein n=1 Tax=Streptosporangium sp. NPDC004379 TaxID=3366189 RepID=UPI0036A1017C